MPRIKLSIVEPDQTPADNLVIRIGIPSDIHECMSLALSACEENGLLSPNPAKLAQEIWSALNLHHGIVGLIGQPGGKAEGIVLLRIGPVWYADDDVLEEKAIFIAPEFRKADGRRGGRLAEFAKQVADKLGMPLLIGVLSNERTQGKVRMYRRIFGEPAGAYFLYGAKTGASGFVKEH